MRKIFLFLFLTILSVAQAQVFPTLTWGDPTLPSALRRFTSEFGMGSGGTTALVPPGKFFVLSTQFFIASAALPALVKSVTYFSMLLPFRRLSPCCCANYCVLNSESKLKILSNPPKHLRRCKVKPHGSLVPVSSTHRCAYTPGLSTSQQRADKPEIKRPESGRVPNPGSESRLI